MMRILELRWVLLTFLFGVFTIAMPAKAESNSAFSDLLETPAPVSVHTTRHVLIAVARADRRLIAVGERGMVLLSDDDGRQWRQAKSVPVSVALTAVTFVSGKAGWAVGHGGVVLHSVDGGETWTRQLEGARIAALALAEAKGVPAGSDDAKRLMRNAESLVSDGPDKPLLGVIFLDEKRGWVVGAYGLALVTEDGGNSWRSIIGRIPNPGARHLYAMANTTGGLVIVGEQGLLFRSTDRGEKFSLVKSPYAGTYFGVLDTKDGNLIAYGLRGNAWMSDANGAWRQIPLGQAATLGSAAQLSNGHVVLADEGGRFFHGDAKGETFTLLKKTSMSGLSSLTEAADGALIAVGVHGVQRVEVMLNGEEKQK